MTAQAACRGCSQPIVAGQMRRGDDWHMECHPLFDPHPVIVVRKRRRAKVPRHEQDIKAPDGYTLGGLRRVRSDGTVLFGRAYWPCPPEWIGERIWVHVADCYGIELEIAPPGVHIYEAQREETARLVAEPVRQARPAYRLKHHRAWAGAPAQPPSSTTPSESKS